MDSDAPVNSNIEFRTIAKSSRDRFSSALTYFTIRLPRSYKSSFESFSPASAIHSKIDRDLLGISVENYEWFSR